MSRPDFPRTLRDFQARFADEAACRFYLAESRWPDGYRCPRCGHQVALDLPARAMWRCKGCGYDTSVTAGTVLHGTRMPLTHWFWAAYLVATHTPGLSALQLQRQLDIRYETAWAMLQKLRRAMVRPDRELLHEKVEVDETYVGGPEAGLRGGARTAREGTGGQRRRGAWKGLWEGSPSNRARCVGTVSYRIREGKRGRGGNRDHRRVAWVCPPLQDGLPA